MTDIKIAVLMLTLLAGCAAAPEPGAIRTGRVVDAPAGYTELCEREPSAPECGENK